MAHVMPSALRTQSFVPDSDTVALDVRQHWVVLIVPVLRTVAGIAALLTDLAFTPVLLFALLTALWVHARLRRGARSIGIITLVAVVVLALLGGREDSVVGPLLGLALLLAWCGEDAVEWYGNRLVVTNKRLYRCYGVVTRHVPSMALTSVVFIDASVPPLGRIFGYGTLRLDSAAQRDAPLSRLDFVPDVVDVHKQVLSLRAAAIPKFPSSGQW